MIIVLEGFDSEDNGEHNDIVLVEISKMFVTQDDFFIWNRSISDSLVKSLSIWRKGMCYQDDCWCGWNVGDGSVSDAQLMDEWWGTSHGATHPCITPLTSKSQKVLINIASFNVGYHTITSCWKMGNENKIRTYIIF